MLVRQQLSLASLSSISKPRASSSSDQLTDCCVFALQVGSTGGTELFGKWKSISRFSEGSLHVSLRRGTLSYASIGPELRDPSADSRESTGRKRSHGHLPQDLRSRTARITASSTFLHQSTRSAAHIRSRVWHRDMGYRYGRVSHPAPSKVNYVGRAG